jgi:hypothetical protein
MDKQPPENKTILAIKSAQPINENGEPCPFADRDIGNLGIQNRILIKHHTDRNGHPLIIPLFLNGAAMIQHEIVTDDGIQENRFFVMIGITAKGEKLPPIRVPVSQFPAMNWVLQWGNKLVHSPGNGNKDNARAAIQVLSGDPETQYVYRHTGFRKIDGQWLFLHGNGAIGSEGENPQICVELDPGNMQRYQLPAPTVQEARRHVGLALDILDVSKTNPVVGVAILCAVAVHHWLKCRLSIFQSFLWVGPVAENQNARRWLKPFLVISMAVHCLPISQTPKAICSTNPTKPKAVFLWLMNFARPSTLLRPTSYTRKRKVCFDQWAIFPAVVGAMPI